MSQPRRLPRAGRRPLRRATPGSGDGGCISPKPRSVDLGAFRSGVRVVQGRGPRGRRLTPKRIAARVHGPSARSRSPLGDRVSRSPAAGSQSRQPLTVELVTAGRPEQAFGHRLLPSARLAALRRTAPMRSDLRVCPQMIEVRDDLKHLLQRNIVHRDPGAKQTSPTPVHGGPASPIECWHSCHRGAPVALTVAMLRLSDADSGALSPRARRRAERVRLGRIELMRTPVTARVAPALRPRLNVSGRGACRPRVRFLNSPPARPAFP